ncbi:hypothetical protein [Actinacidiphila sp. bgisy145]|uniref:hypothetical protein n=1 Tax=Actinacidiphila sp. bgisy145 TaxID=3413792 RepID=UPI003EB6AD7C
MIKLDSSDLRALADALDCLHQTTTQTRVIIDGYSDTQVTFRDSVLRLTWEPTKGSANDMPEGRYVVQFED